LNLAILPSFAPHYREVPYSDFIEQVEAGKVERAIVAPDRIQYVLKPQPNSPSESPPVSVTTPVAIDLDLPKILREHDVEFTAPRFI
jgi:cell division protease FtsH